MDRMRSTRGIGYVLIGAVLLAVVALVALRVLGLASDGGTARVRDPVGAQGACERIMRRNFQKVFSSGDRLDIEPSNVEGEPDSPVHVVHITANIHTRANGDMKIRADCTVRKDGADWTLLNYVQAP